MKLGTLTAALGDLPLDEACGFLAGNGVQMVEIGCGGFPGTAHCDAAELLADERKREAFLETLDRYHLQISALSSHGNMVHPNPEIAKKFDDDLTNAILLAEKLGVSRQAVTKWETDGGIPDIENMMAISTLFDISIDELLGREKGVKKPDGYHRKSTRLSSSAGKRE